MKWKTFTRERDRIKTHDLCDTDEVLYQLTDWQAGWGGGIQKDRQMDGWTHERKDGTATNSVLLELVQDRSRRWHRSKHIVTIFSWTPDSLVFLWALAVQLLLWVLVTRPDPVMQQERDFLGLRVSLGYRLVLGDLALDKWWSRICSLIPTTLNDKSVLSGLPFIFLLNIRTCLLKRSHSYPPLQLV